MCLADKVSFTESRLRRWSAPPSTPTVLQLLFNFLIKLSRDGDGVASWQVVVHPKPFGHPAFPRVHYGRLSLVKCGRTGIHLLGIVHHFQERAVLHVLKRHRHIRSTRNQRQQKKKIWLEAIQWNLGCSNNHTYTSVATINHLSDAERCRHASVCRAASSCWNLPRIRRPRTGPAS